MELLYEVKPDLDGAEDYVVSTKRMRLAPQRKPLIAVSVRNLIAFSSFVDLTINKKGNRNNNNNSGTSTTEESEIAGAHVYIADFNTPWETYLIKNSAFQITHLQWDHPGAKLLVGTDNGEVEVYTMVDHLLNKWQVSYGGSFPGEPIVTSCWLGLPRKVGVNPDKLDSMVYSEKYNVSVLPSTRGFGGKPLDGCVIITATGLVGAIVCNSCDDPAKPLTTTEKMVAIRNQIIFADMAYSKDGDIVIVTCNDNLKLPILVNRIKVSLVGCRDKAEIKTTASQSLFLPYLAEHSISSAQFISKISTDHLLISLINRATGSSWLCLYELVVQPVSLKSRFQTSSNELVNTYRWQQTAQVQFGSAIASICTLPLQLISSANAFGSGSGSSMMQNPLQNQNQQTTATLTPLIAVSLSNGSVILTRCDNLQQVGTITPSQNQGTSGSLGNLSTFSIKRERDEIDVKHVKSGCKFSSSGSVGQTNTGNGDSNEMYVSMSFSWSGSILVALGGNSHLHVYKIHPNLDASTASILIELSMMGGLDPWDVMMCVRPNLIENITDRLSETFARQLPSVQTHYNARILVMKAALYRLATGGTARINDQQTLLTLYLVSGALKALLRPGELSSHDKGPAESLSNLLSTKGEALSDLDKVLIHVVPKEYTVEASTLQSLQQFLQWCADLALKLLATLPDLRHSRAGWEVCRDSKAVGTLRELIVLMRIWGLIRPSCLPSFRKTSENLDVLPLLFRLLTRLSVAPHDPDESLIDECCLLPSEVQIPSHNAYLPSKSLGVSSSVIFSRGSPHQFHYGVNPVKWWVNGVESNGNWMDGLRLLWLGKNPAGVKVCNRCGCCTLSQLPPRSTANKAWDQRWLRSCPCGGNWKIPSFLPQPKVDTDPFLNF